MSEKLEFTNRTEILENISIYVKAYLKDEITFHTIDIFGMGGIGKSRLLQEINNRYHENKELLIHELSFEIMDSKNELYGLIRLRMLFKKVKCPLFDYAFNNFCEKFTLLTASSPENLNDMKQLWEDLISIIPGYDEVKGYLDFFYKFAKRYQYLSEDTKYIQQIKDAREEDCLELLQKFLAIDLRNNLKCKLLLLIDAYNLYDSLNKEDIWLRDFVLSFSYGIILISGRESLEWKEYFDEGSYEEFPLKRFPENDTKNLLKKYLPDDDLAIAMKFTEGIPFYVHIVVQLYKEKNCIVWKDIKTRDNIVVKFMDHFDKDVQHYVRIMCEVRIFDKKISEYMIREGRLNVTFIHAEYIYSTNMANFCTKDHSLYKFHDILVASNHHPHKSEITTILCMYFRGINGFLSTYNDEECKILFDNVLYLLEHNDKGITLIEAALDVLLNIIDIGIQINILDKVFSLQYLLDIQQLLASFWLKKRSTNLCKEALDKIKDPSQLGRHKKSYDVLYTYSNSLLNGYQLYQKELMGLNMNLEKGEAGYWYYGRIKNYLGESYMMQSNFKESVVLLLEHLETLDSGTNDHYQTLRHLGHNYRFSFQLDTAIEYYKRCERQYTSRTSLLDIYTNLAECYCYLDAGECLKYCEKVILESKELERNKALAKAYYAKAVALSIEKKEFEEAYYLIKQSEQLNLEDGYQAGLIFTYMAKAVIEVLDQGFPQTKTIATIHTLTDKLEVYKFFEYYIERLANSPNANECFDKYTWILPEVTKANFDIFIQRLRSL